MSVQHIQLRAKEPTSALAQKLQAPKGIRYGGEVKPYAGPFSDWERKGTTNAAKGYFRPGAGSLEEALRAATPATGSAIDIQGQAWKRREEIVAANQAKLDAQADALYGSVQGLSKPDQDFILSKVAGKSTSAEALGKALGAAPGVISATSVGKDPLMKAMIDKNYIKETTKGYEWMLPEKEKKSTATTKWTDESGWTHITTSYEDGTTKDETIGREAPEAAEPPSGSEIAALGNLEIAQTKEAERFYDSAIKNQGTMPAIGDEIEAPILWGLGNKKIKVTAANVKELQDNWTRGVKDFMIKSQEALGMMHVQANATPEMVIEMKRKLEWPEEKINGEWTPEFEQAIIDLGVL